MKNELRLQISKVYKSAEGRLIHIVMGNPPVDGDAPWNGIYWGNSVDGKHPQLEAQRYTFDGKLHAVLSQFSSLPIKMFVGTDGDLIEEIDYTTGEYVRMPDEILTKKYKVFAVFSYQTYVTLYTNFKLYPEKYVLLTDEGEPQPWTNFGDTMLFEEDVTTDGAFEAYQIEKNILENKLTFSIGDRINIPVGVLEFNMGSNTIWIQSPQGSTILRIKCTGKILVESCTNSPTSHSDIMVDGDIHFCLSEDAI